MARGRKTVKAMTTKDYKAFKLFLKYEWVSKLSLIENIGLNDSRIKSYNTANLIELELRNNEEYFKLSKKGLAFFYEKSIDRFEKLNTNMEHRKGINLYVYGDVEYQRESRKGYAIGYLEYKGNKKHFQLYKEQVHSPHVIMLNLIADAIKEIKEPCNITLHSRYPLGMLSDNKRISDKTIINVREKILCNILELEGNHKLTFENICCKNRNKFYELEKKLKTNKRVSQ